MVVSIIGTDRFTGGYGAAKVAHERAALEGPIPAVILRAAQFHEFVAQLIEWGTQGDVSYVPQMRTQLVAARTVAEALADLATEPDGATISEIAGPREERLAEVAGLLASRDGSGVTVRGDGGRSDDPDMQVYGRGRYCRDRRPSSPAPRLSGGSRGGPDGCRRGRSRPGSGARRDPLASSSPSRASSRRSRFGKTSAESPSRRVRRPGGAPWCRRGSP